MIAFATIGQRDARLVRLDSERCPPRPVSRSHDCTRPPLYRVVDSTRWSRGSATAAPPNCGPSMIAARASCSRTTTAARSVERMGSSLVRDLPTRPRYALGVPGELAGCSCVRGGRPRRLRDLAREPPGRRGPRRQTRRGGRPAKPLAARVMSLARGGQILLTDAAQRALGVALPEGTELKSHGHYRLKGIEAPIEVFELGVGDACRSSRRPMSTRHTAWCARATSGFRCVTCATICRPSATRSSAAARDARADGRLDAGTRLVTVVGRRRHRQDAFREPCGWRQLGDWPGGVYFCDLSEARTLEGVLSAVAVRSARRCRQRDPVQQIGHAIAGRGRCLVILDNFEQVVALAAETLGRWLDRAGDAAFVVTSRERLYLRGEEVFALEPLPPDRDAIDLFVDRRAGAEPDVRAR